MEIEAVKIQQGKHSNQRPSREGKPDLKGKWLLVRQRNRNSKCCFKLQQERNVIQGCSGREHFIQDFFEPRLLSGIVCKVLPVSASQFHGILDPRAGGYPRQGKPFLTPNHIMGSCQTETITDVSITNHILWLSVRTVVLIHQHPCNSTCFLSLLALVYETNQSSDTFPGTPLFWQPQHPHQHVLKHSTVD